ncbi:MAG: hypothetical protein QOF76_5321 [Solirubrobacteraceae bacterium]|jgi:hypothetical protein|nr:hypothetical protein [Solirubrobacteraceae bacterium]
MAWKLLSVAVIAIALLTPAAAGAATATTIGPGTKPGLAVDAAGTAYIAYNGPEVNNNAPLLFCRLPRGATVCDAGIAKDLGAAGNSLSRPFVTVTGDRVVVVQYRYGAGVAGFGQLYRFTSADRGGSFAPGAAVGKIGFTEAVAGPGDTLSGVTESDACGMCFQNVVLSGDAPVDTEGRTTVPYAVLSSTRPYGGAVGLVDAATPLAVFADGSGAQQFRRYTGSGSLNDQASWSAPADIADPLAAPKLAGGPSGLFMLGNAPGNAIMVRKFDGAAFGPSVQIGGALGVNQHLFQDAAGRLHAVWHRFGESGIELVHAVSDDGVTWTSGVAVTQPGADDFGDPRVATAPDHVGVVVWHAQEGIRTAPVGPGAPAKLRPLFKANGSAKRKGGKVRYQVSSEILRPDGVTPAAGCSGTVVVTLLRGDKQVARKTAKVDNACRFAVHGKIRGAKVKGAQNLTVRAAFSGNTVFRARTQTGSASIK